MRCHLRPSDYRNSMLCSEMAGLWVRQARASSWKLGTAQQSAGAVRDLVRFLDKRRPHGGYSLVGPGDDLGDELISWRDDVRARGRDRMWRATLLLLRRARFEGFQLQPTLLLLATQAGWAYKSSGAETPLDEYSNAERIAQMRAATASVEACETRLSRGFALFESDDRLKNAVAFAQSTRPYLAIAAAVRGDRHLADGMESALQAPLPATPLRLVQSIGSLLSPTPLELMSFQILLMWGTGLAPEQVRDVHTDDIELEPGRLRWESFKARSRTLMRLQYEGDEPWRVPSLMRRTAESTAIARSYAGSNRIFTTFTVSALGQGALTFKPMPHPSPTLRDWLRDQGIQSSEPHDLRRIRKAVKAMRAGVSSSAEEAARPDHSLRTFSRHYAGTTTSLSRSGRVIIQAQERVHARVSQHRAVVVPTSSSTAAQSHVDGDVQSVANQVAASSPVERSLSASACSNPTSSPFMPNGQWCTKAPFACMLCPNAVIFNDHAPQLLLMKAEVQARRDTTAPDEYAAVLLPVADAIDDYLGQMSASVLQGAQARIEREEESLVLPLTQRQQHDA